MKKREIVAVLFVALISLGAMSLVIYTSLTTSQTSNKQTTQTFAAESNFDQYCRDGLYYVNKEGKQISCGRAPNCGGKSYDQANAHDWRKNAECWVEDYYGGDYCKAYCAGNIPLCCYKMAITKNHKDCTWPERGYCLPSQCQGIGQNCGVPMDTHCYNNCRKRAGDIPYIPLENRVAGNNHTQTPPTNTPAPTKTQAPTETPLPVQPTIAPTQTPQNTPRPVAPQPTSSNTIPTNTYAPALPITSQAPLIYPTTVPQPFPTTSAGFPNPPSFSLPAPSFQNPQELARTIINPETITRVDQATAKPLSIPKEGIERVIAIDRAIEKTSTDWWRFLWSLIQKAPFFNTP